MAAIKKKKVETTTAKYNDPPYWAAIRRKKKETTAVKRNGMPITT